ncbi:MAG: hypothetical protein NT062_35600 [Proteobacteria bacterium]|nr:hypothetical protein [Pseudomonadota bacterium]
MRPLLVATVATVLSLGSIASAETILGTYEVKYEVSSNNCPNEFLKFARGDLKIAMKGALVAVDIERIPMMTGQPTKTGKITAKSKLGRTAVAGMEGVFQVAGRVQNGLLSLVFTGEYQTQGHPLCTQSWSISGTRKDDEPVKPAPKSVPKKT